jgi:hypothetical protein
MKKQLINETKRMQQLAGILVENEDSSTVKTLHMSYPSLVGAGVAFQTEKGMQLLKQAIGDFDVKYMTDFTPEVTQAYDEFEDQTYEEIYNEASKALFVLLRALKDKFPEDIVNKAVSTDYDGVEGWNPAGPAAFIDNEMLNIKEQQLIDILKSAGINVVPKDKLLTAFVEA